MKKFRLFLILLAVIGLSFNMNAQSTQTGTYTGTANVTSQALSLNETLSNVDVIINSENYSYNLVIDQIDLGGNTYTPIIEIPNCTILPQGTGYILTAQDMNIVIPEVIVSGLTLTNIPALVKFKNGSINNNVLTLNIEVTLMGYVSITIQYNGTKNTKPFPGIGSIGQPWELWKIIDIYKLRAEAAFCPQCLWDKFFKMMANMDFGAYQSNEPWYPIGAGPDYAFFGHFDGNNKKIKGFKFKTDSTKRYRYIGLFGYIGNGSVKNLGLEDVDVDFYFEYEEEADEVYAGGIAACIGNNAKILNCYTTGKVRNSAKWGVARSGGVAGRVSEQSMVADCYSTAEVESNSDTYAVAGGIAGTVYTATVKNSYSTGKVRSRSERETTTGGVVGEIGPNYGDFGSNVSECVAFNEWIEGSGKTATLGRVVGKSDVQEPPVDTLVSLAAQKDLTGRTPEGEVEWDRTCPFCIDGEDLTKEFINADATIGNRFLAANGWKVEKGSLPGLFNTSVPMPEYLHPVGVKIIKNGKINVYPNPTNGGLTIDNGKLTINSIELFDVMGKKLIEDKENLMVLRSYDLTVFPAGIYFLKITTEQGIETKKIIKQ